MRWSLGLPKSVVSSRTKVSLPHAKGVAQISLGILCYTNTWLAISGTGVCHRHRNQHWPTLFRLTLGLPRHGNIGTKWPLVRVRHVTFLFSCDGQTGSIMSKGCVPGGSRCPDITSYILQILENSVLCGTFCNWQVRQDLPKACNLMPTALWSKSRGNVIQWEHSYWYSLNCLFFWSSYKNIFRSWREAL